MKRFAVPAVIALIASVLALAGFEVLLRAIGWSSPIWYQPDPELGWRMRPGVAGWYTKEGRAWVEINAEGRRDAPVPTEKRPDVYRIAVLGDSYAEAMQVPRDQAFWALLPERLRACGFAPGKRVEALNFGVSGYGTAQEYLTLQSRALAYHPDLVLLQFTNGNDVQNNSFALEDERNRPFFHFDADGELRLNRFFASSADFRRRSSPASERLRTATNYLRVLQLVRAAREAPLMGRAHAQEAQGIEQGLEPLVLAPPVKYQWREAWLVTEALIAMTAEAARASGARFALVTVPYAIQVHPERPVREALQAKLGVADLFYPDRRLERFAERNHILAVTLAPEMQRLAESSGTYFHGFGDGRGKGHWNAEGHRAAADIIARRLCAQPG